jgi:CheY-like chemotaxis protein
MSSADAQAGVRPPDASVPLHGDAHSRVRVLIIDDNADIRDSLAVVIRLLGADAASAPDGEQGLAAGCVTPPDLVLLDVGLPGMDGYGVARSIRAHEWGQRTFLVAMTGWTRDSDRALAAAAGFDTHVAKPVDVRTLRTLLERAAPSRATVTPPQ